MNAETVTAGRLRLGGFGRTRTGLGRSGLAAAALALIGLLVLVVQARALIAALYLNPDYASAPVIGTLLGHAPDGRVVTLGNYPWYESLWVLQATEWLPGHRQIWQGIPFVVSLATIALLVHSSARTFGPWAAAMTAAVLAATSTGLRPVLFSLNAHGGAVTHAVILGVALVVVAGRPALTRRTMIALGVGLAAFTAVGETDRLLLLTGILPFALAPLVAWWLTGQAAYRRLAIFAVVVSAAATAGGELLTSAMHHDDILPLPSFILRFAAAGELIPHVQTLLDSLAYLGGGGFFSEDIDGKGLIDLVSGGTVILGLVAVLIAAGRWTRRRLAEPVATPGAPEPSPVERSRTLFILFWSLSLVVTVLAFIVTSVPVDTGSSRYVVIAFIAMAVLLPPLAQQAPRARPLLVVGLLAFVVSVVGRHVVDGVEVFGGGPSKADAGAVARYLRSQGLKTGYAGYQDAPVLTWASRGDLEVYPLYTDPSCTTGPLCPFPLHTISSWYKPRPNSRTFVIAHTPASYTQLGGPPPAGLGTPVTSRPFGALVVYVYDHDVASKLKG
ncbi:MAG: hypothetical protein JWQ20_1327 [Conexibacter sp.]|nr:hypothetical protein [Conexibacter sp.]